MNLSELKKVRNHDYHKYLGIDNIDTKDGKAVIEIEVKEHIINPSGTFHGGIIYTLCDITAFCSLLSLTEEGQIGVTNNFNIQVMRAVGLGEIVKFEAIVIKKGKRLAFIECNVFAKEKLIAKATITKTMIFVKA